MDTPNPDSNPRLVLDSAPALIHTALPDGYLDFFNQTWLTYVGRSLEDLQGWKWTASIHPDDLDAMLQAWRTALASGEPFVHEARVRRADGEYRWMLHHKIALRDEHGNVVKWYGSSIDIEERKRVEESSRASEKRFRTLVDHATDAFGLIDERGIIVDVNREACESRGYRREEMIGMSVSEIDPDVDLDAMQKRFAAGEQVVTFESRNRRKDGTLFPVEVRTRRFVSPEGRVFSLTLGRDITERKRAEKTLRESEERYRALIEVSPQMIWMAGADGPNTYFNQWWYDYTGLTQAESEGFGWAQVVHPEHRDRFIELWRQHVASDSEWTTETPLRRAADGQYRWHLSRGVPIRDADGRVVRWIGVAIDIHDRREAEEALRESEARYRALIEVSPQMVFITRADGSNSYFNQWVYDYTGLTQAESEGFGWVRVAHPEHRDRFIESWLQHVASGSEFSSEVPVRRAADGQYRWHLCRARPIRDADGRIVRWIGIAIDIHDRREAEESLRRTEEWLSEAQRLSHTGSWAMNRETRQVVYASKEFLRITGFDEGEGIPSTEAVLGRIHPDDRPGAIEDLERGLRETTDYTGMRRLALPDGTIRHIHYVVHPAFDAAGRPVELIGTVVDVTERKQAEDALRQAQATLTHVARVATVGEVTASIAHELNQPLGAMANNANACLGILSSANPDLEEVRGALADIVADAERASAIIERVRGMAKRSAPERVPMPLSDLVREVVGLAAAESASRRVAIRTDVPGDLPRVLGDRVQLQQVLLNLVVNGMDAMSGAGESDRTLEIRGQAEELDGHPAARISVQDRGIGVHAEQIDQLFEPFYTTKSHGMGLGLAISRSIIEAHGGRLWAEANPGLGATFSFALPAAAAGH